MPSRPSRHKPSKLRTEKHSAPEQQRLNSTQRGYGYRWQKTRLGYLAKHPLCVMCEQEGIVKAATDVDHIVPHKGDMNLFWMSSNWQSLCKSHHSAKTAREDGGFGR